MLVISPMLSWLLFKDVLSGDRVWLFLAVEVVLIGSLADLVMGGGDAGSESVVGGFSDLKHRTLWKRVNLNCLTKCLY